MQVMRGVTLIELMIAMAIGMVLLLGVVHILTSNQHTYRMNDNVGRIQENARIALEMMSRDLRSAGGTSCMRVPREELAELAGGSRRTASVNVIANPPIPGGLGVGVEIRGFDAGGYQFIGGAADPRLIAAADGFHVGRMDDCPASLVGNMGTTNANIQLDGTAQGCGFAAGQLLIISDCESMDVFRPTNVNNGAITVMAHSNAVNTSNFLSKAYDTSASVARHRAVGYYLALNQDAANPASVPRANLMLDEGRGQLNPALVEGVEDMQILYGVDQSGNFAADVFVTATNVADWSTVVAVQLNLLLASDPTTTLLPDPQNYQWFGNLATATANVVAPDWRLYRTFSQTVTLRNRVP